MRGCTRSPRHPGWARLLGSGAAGMLVITSQCKGAQCFPKPGLAVPVVSANYMGLFPLSPFLPLLSVEYYFVLEFVFYNDNFEKYTKLEKQDFDFWSQAMASQ